MPKFIRRLFSKKILTSYNALCNEPFQICGLSQESGFVFKNGQRASYPLAYVGGKPYKWIITNNLIVLECFDVCSVINPIPSIVILGTGSECLLLPQHLVTKFKKDKLSIECLKTINAIGLVNSMLQENRSFIGFLGSHCKKYTFSSEP